MLAFWNECAGRGGRLANGRLVAAGAEALMNTRASDRIAEEQAALRRVATLAALGAPAEEVFTAVTTEVWRLLDVDLTAMARYDPDDVMTYVARWGTTSDARGGGMHTTLGGRNIGTLVFETGRLTRMDDFSTASGPAADLVRMLGIRSSVGSPILKCSGPAMGRHARVIHKRDAAAAGHRGAAGRVHRTGRHRDRQRPGTRRTAPLRRRAGRAAAGRDARRRRKPPEEVFAAVAAEAGRLHGADLTGVGRYEPGEEVTVLGAWSSTGVRCPSRLAAG